MIAAADSGLSLVSIIIGAGAILGGAGYAIGQFMSSRRRGVSDALSTALDEVAAMKLRADRFGAEAAETKAANVMHQAAIEELKRANATLATVKVSTDLTEAVERAIRNSIAELESRVYKAVSAAVADFYERASREESENG